jgi:beta-mannan synthase
MDLSLRAYLQGWRFVFLYDVTCVNELPASYDAYRKQQHRWSCGPMQLWRKATAAVWQSNISWAQKLYLNVFFFGTRLFATHVVSFVFYCTLVPIAVMTPEVRIPFWALVYMPLLITCSTVAFTPGCASSSVHRSRACLRAGPGLRVMLRARDHTRLPSRSARVHLTHVTRAPQRLGAHRGVCAV